MRQVKSHKKYSTRKRRAASKEQISLLKPDNGAQPKQAQPDISFEKDLGDAAVRLRGNIAPADYKHYVLPLLFLRYLSLKYKRRKEQLETSINKPTSEYFTKKPKRAQEILE
jgi:type I restriction-modification system DNA methylase subunit